MPLVVELRSADGEVLERIGRADYSLERLLPESNDTEFCFLRYIDEYGDTYFSSLQAVGLLPEIENLRRRAVSQQSKRLVDELAQLAEKCQQGAHLFLVFVGD